MEDSKELQNVSHLVRSPLNFLGSSLKSLTLELPVPVTSWWGTGVTVLVTTVVVLASEQVVESASVVVTVISPVLLVPAVVSRAVR